jgi:hypothetical protein
MESCTSIVLVDGVLKMREIKFRVWCKEGPSMLAWDYLISELDFVDFMKGAHVEDAY